MYRSIIAILFCLFGGYVSAHQFTPTYPEFEAAYISGVKVVRMNIFNSREEIDWYSISVFDKDWKSVAFASTDKLINLKYLDRKSVEVFVRASDVKKVVYICSKSKTLSSNKNPSIITSRICSKVRKNETLSTAS